MKEEKQLLNEFEICSDEDWKNQVISDLKGSAKLESLAHEDANGIIHKPYYRASDLEEILNLEKNQAAQRKDLNWQILEEEPEDNDSLISILFDGVNEEQILNSLSQKSTIINAGAYLELGANQVSQIALGLHHVLSYLDHWSEGSENLLAHFQQLKIKLSVGPAYFIEIAKIRAFKTLLARLLSLFGHEEEIHVIAEVSSYELAHQDAHSNLIRSTTMAMSAVIGGCHSLFIPGYNDLEKSDAHSKRMAKNIQHLLKNEAYFNQVIDPSSGSYYIESLSNELCNKAWDLFIEIEEKGGLIEIAKSGELKSMLQNQKEKRIASFKKGERALIGVNQFENELGLNLQAIKPSLSQDIKK